MRTLLFATLFALSYAAQADSFPFDLPATHPTLTQTKSDHMMLRAGNGSGQAGIYRFDTASFQSPGLRSAVGKYDEQGRLISLMATYDRDKYSMLVETMDAKYQVQERITDPLGGQVVTYHTEGYAVTVNAPSMERVMTVRMRLQ